MTVVQTPRKKLAIITTVWKYLSHAQHMGDRFLVGYPDNGRWHRPEADVVALYVDQKPAGDLSEQRAKEFGFKVYPTIAEALCLGGDRLAVDGVLIIGEHGSYKVNAKGQMLYPRYEFFQQTADVFEKSQRSVPVFNDKNLSYSFEKAKAMVERARRLKIPFIAGSSVPVAWRLPSLEIPLNSQIEEALIVGVGGSDAMDYHVLEAMQCMVERRQGGETGVKAVQMIQGDAVWQAGQKGQWSQKLLAAALARSDSPRGFNDGRPVHLMEPGLLQRLVKQPAAYLIEYKDGLRATLLMLNGALQDYNFAAKLQGNPRILSTQFYLTPTPNVTYSARLMAGVEKMFMTGTPTYPVERTLIVSGILDRCLDSKVQGNARIETPDLDVRYQPPASPAFGG